MGALTGSHPHHVWELLEEFKRFQKMVSKMKHLKIGKNGEMPQMARTPHQAMQQMGKCLDPRMLKQIGGMSGLQVRIAVVFPAFIHACLCIRACTVYRSYKTFCFVVVFQTVCELLHLV